MCYLQLHLGTTQVLQCSGYVTRRLNVSVVFHPSEWADSRVCLALPVMVDVSSISHEAAVWFWHEYAFSFLSKYLGSDCVSGEDHCWLVHSGSLASLNSSCLRA